LNRRNAINAWNAANLNPAVGVDCDGDPVKPISSFGILVSTHVPVDVTWLNPNIGTTVFPAVADRMLAVIQFLRDMADALEGKNG